MSQRNRNIPGPDPLAFLAGGGEMGERTRAFDWSKTPVGPVADVAAEPQDRRADHARLPLRHVAGLGAGVHLLLQRRLRPR